MMAFVAIMLSFIFVLLAIIHLYWSFGGYWGKDVAIPAKENNSKIFLPGAVSTFIIAILFLMLEIFILIKANFLFIKIPSMLNKYGLWIIALIFFARAIGEFKYVGFFKKVKRTVFAQYDTRFYSPLCLIAAILLIILQLSCNKA